jgi:hypothetical protein
LKRTASILLLGILCFNWFGYQLLNAYLEDRANNSLEAQLDDHQYEESQLLLIKVPAVHLAYYTSSSQFERVDGQVEIEGVQYKFVKRRLYNDSLELLCIPNHAAMRLQTAKDEFFKLVNDLQQTGQNKKSDSHPGASKNFSTDYYTVNDPFNMSILSFDLIKQSAHFICDIPFSFSPVAAQPPDFC